MTTNELDGPASGGEQPGSLSRRAVVRAGANAAWMVPAISVVTAAPALATTGPSGPSAFSNMVPAEGSTTYTDDNQVVVLSGRIQPAFPNRPVSLHQVNGDGTTEPLQVTNADADGNFTFVTTLDHWRTLRFSSDAQTKGSITYGAVNSQSFTVRSLYFYDDFSSYATIAEMSTANGGPWYARNTNYTDGTKHTKGSFDALYFTNITDQNGKTFKALAFTIVADGNDPTDTKRRFKVPSISPGKLGVVNGYLEARIRWHRPQGAHSALWWQSGYGTGGGEFDVVEFMGRRTATNSSQNVQHIVHLKADQSQSAGGNTWTNGSISNGLTLFQKTNFSTGDRATWWEDFHT